LSETNWQKIAAAVASLKHFSVITGGPGTGKTFTVTKVLALLLEQVSGQKLQIYLAAPTGKAASRLKDAVDLAKSQMNCDESIKAAIPSEAFTIHRMLKPGGVLVSSTACVSDMMWPLRLIVPVGRFLRLFPAIRVFSAAALKGSLENAGFEIDHEWQPKKKPLWTSTIKY